MFRTVVDCSTGEVTQVELTQAEIDEAIANAPPPIAPVYTCSPWQIRKALNNLDLRQAVEDAVGHSGDITLQDGWNYATEFRSNDPFVISMGASLGMTEQQTADLIQMASTL